MKGGEQFFTSLGGINVTELSPMYKAASYDNRMGAVLNAL